LFAKRGDYEAFERIVVRAVKIIDRRRLAIIDGMPSI